MTTTHDDDTSDSDDSAERHSIAASLRSLAVPVDNVTPLPDNPRRGDVRVIARSLRRFGLRKPLVARHEGTDSDGNPVGTVIAGNHTLLAARDLGWSHVAVTWVDDDEITAKAYALADNRTHDVGTYDDDLVAELLAELIAHDDKELLQATAYDDAAIQRFLGSEDTTTDTDPALDAGTYSIIVTCRDEGHQAELLEAFEKEGLDCRPLMM